MSKKFFNIWKKKKEWCYTCPLYTEACVLSHQSCLTLCDPMDCSPPGCSVHGVYSHSDRDKANDIVQMWENEKGLCLRFEGVPVTRGFPGGSVVKNLPVNAGDSSLIPGSGRSSGGGNGSPLKYSCLENLIDKGAWWATVQGVARAGHNGAYVILRYSQNKYISQINLKYMHVCMQIDTFYYIL